MPKKPAHHAPVAYIHGLNLPVGVVLAKVLHRRGIWVTGIKHPDLTIKPSNIPQTAHLLKDAQTAQKETYDYLIYLTTLEALKPIKRLLTQPIAQSRKALFVVHEPLAGIDPTIIEELQQKKDPKTLLFSTKQQTKRHQNLEKLQAIVSQHKNTNLIILRDVIGHQTFLVPHNPTQLLFSALPWQQILVAGDQSHGVAPLLIDDAVTTIMTHLLGKFLPKKTWLLEGNQKQPLINIAFQLENMLQNQFNLTPTIQTVPQLHVKSPKTDHYPLLKHKQITKLDDTLLQTLNYLEEHRYLKNATTPLDGILKKPTKPAKPPVKKTTAPRNKFLKRAIMTLLVFISLYAGIVAAPLFGQALLHHQISRLQPLQANQAAINRLYELNQLSHQLAITAITPVKLAPTDHYKNLNRILTQVSIANQLAIYQTAIKAQLVQVSAIMFGEQPGDTMKHLNTLSGYLDRGLTLSNLAQINPPANMLPATLQNHLAIFETDNLTNLKSKLHAARQLVQSSKDFLSQHPQSTWAVLLQDNLELRPTGGYLDSVMLLTLDQGKIINQNVQTTSSLDAKLQGRVDPPVELSRYLNEDNWYLRDANWDPDFQSTRNTIIWFLDKQRNQSVDGVIALDLHYFNSLLEVLGPIELSDGTVINHNNLEALAFQSAQQLKEDNQTNDSFVSQVGEQLYQNINQASPEKQFKVIQTSFEAATRKHLLISAPYLPLERALSDLTFAGQLIAPTCPAELSANNTCISDYLHVNETNIGINKANHLITRRHQHSLRLSDNSMSHNHTIFLEHTGTKTQYPGGHYQTLIRFYIPPNSQVAQLDIDQEAIASEDFTVSVDHQKTVVSLPTTVRVGERQIISLDYQIPPPIPNREHFAYTLLIQKQPGTAADPFTISLALPDFLQAASTSHPVTQNGNILSHETTLEKNQFFAVELQRDL